ncbi:hypothetical protein FUA48_14970 [Flavobacterium alkalisoli]|uniref:histidine kinase n=1 Tax=Flavobacterium alkalisoli TaxID=2602769 RepID=A0A5B9FU42_9FLAO|nr:histidine kinase [Flavobacterium alkalisoli]QEE50833.1 hypothetical protein FUA48_14970 [Flavobacterium alkalisoli]
MEKWLDPKTIALWIVIVLLIISLLAFSFIRLVRINFRRIVVERLKESRTQIEHQKQLLETGIIAQEQERTRIAADLHDSLIGKLTVLRLKNQTAQNTEEIDSLLGESIAEARRISHDLTPPMPKFITLDELIENVLAPWKKQFTLTFRKSIYSEKNIPNDLKIQIVRVIQEIIINIHKHAEATNVFVHLRMSPTLLSITIKDNGKGFDVEKAKKGIGLKNIELRMLFIKGHHKIKTGNKGTTAILVLNHSKIESE